MRDGNATVNPSWRDFIKVHPATDLLAPPGPEARAELAADIKANGMLVQPVTWKGQDIAVYLIDGCCRLDALELNGVRVIDENGNLCVPADARSWETDPDPVALVVGLNIHRRHLTGEQKRELIAKLIVADPTRSARQVAKLAGVSPTTAVNVRDELIAKGDVSNLDTSRDTRSRQQPTRRHGRLSTPWRAAAKQKSKAGASQHSQVDEIVHDLHRLAGNGLDITSKDLLTAVTQQGKRAVVIGSARLTRDWLDELLAQAEPQHSTSSFNPSQLSSRATTDPAEADVPAFPPKGLTQVPNFDGSHLCKPEPPTNPTKE